MNNSNKNKELKKCPYCKQQTFKYLYSADGGKSGEMKTYTCENPDCKYYKGHYTVNNFT